MRTGKGPGAALRAVATLTLALAAAAARGEFPGARAYQTVEVGPGVAMAEE